MDLAVAVIGGFVKIIVTLVSLLFQLFAMIIRGLTNLSRSR